MDTNLTLAPRPQEATSGRIPRLNAHRIGLVSRDFRHKYGGRLDFSEVLPEVLALLDDCGCDAVLFSLFTIIRRKSFEPLKGLKHLRSIDAILYEEFTGRRFVGGRWENIKGNAKSRYVVLHRRKRGWGEYEFRQKFGSLSPPTKKHLKEVADFVRLEIPRRTLGNCCVLLCGESNAVKYSPKDGKIHDDFHLTKAIPKGADIILNPIHDRMTRFEMRRKRAFLSKGGRWVISVWNKGKMASNGKVSDGELPPWSVFFNNKERPIQPIQNKLGLDIGIVDIEEG